MLARVFLTLMILLSFAAPAAGQEADPLAGQWHFDAEFPTSPEDPESQRYTPDSSGGGRDLEWCNGCANLGEGRWGNGYDAASSSWGLAAPGADLQRITLMAWVRTGAYPSSSSLIAGRGVGGVTCEEMPYSLQQLGGDALPGAAFTIRKFDGSAVLSPVSARIDDDQWHMLAGTFDGTTVRLYLDGQQVGTGTPAGTSAIDYGPGGGSFGIDGFWSSGCEGGSFGGNIDELRVYDRALSATEIARLADGSATSPPPLVSDGSAPPTPPAPDGPAPPSSPPPPPAPPTATVTAPSSVATHQPAVLDAGNSQNATQYQWDVGSNGKTDIVTSTPMLTLSMPRPGVYPVKLTTVSSGGQTASASAVFRVTGAQPPKSLPATALPPPVAISGNKAALTGDATKPTFVCSQKVIFSIVEVTSACFDQATKLTDVPKRERDVVARHYQSEGFSGTVASICAQAARGELPQSRCEDAKKFFGPIAGPPLLVMVSKGPVRMNGLTITPGPGASIAVYPKQGRVISSNATVKWGTLPVSLPRAIDFNIGRVITSRGVAVTPTNNDPFPAPRRAQLLTFDARKALSNIGGFPVPGGNATADLGVEARDGQRFSSADLTVTVPLLDAFGGKPPSLRTRIRANGAGTPVVQELDALLPQANLGAIRLKNLSFRYREFGRIDGDYNEGTSCDRKQWRVNGEVYFGVLDGKVDMSPPPSGKAQNGLGFCAGGFKHFGADVTLPEPKPVLFPGVQLNNINFGVGLDPLLFRGGAGIEVAKINRVNGEIVAVFATPRAPYRFGPSEKSYLRDLQGKDPFTSTTFGVGGEVFTRVPVLGDVKLGQGGILYSYPDYFAFGGSTKVTALLITVEGGISGWFRFKSGKFQLGGFVRTCLNLPKPFNFLCRGGSAYVGSKGISACIEVGIDIGAGYRWGAPFPVLMLRNNCKHSPFWEPNTAQASATTHTFTVRRGEKYKSLMVRGAGGASPSIEVRAPGGEVVSTADNPLSNGKTMSVLRLERGATYVAVENGQPGRYTVSTLPGSAQLGRVAATRPGYDTEFKARVTGKGAVRTLVYDARKPGGQNVTFVERGSRVARPLLTVRGGKGKFRFRPSVVPGRARSIVAVSTLNGYAIPDQTLARFRAPAIPKTGRARKLSVRRKGTVLTLRWSKAQGATRYGVALRLSNGQMRMFQVSARRRSLRIPRVPRDLAGRVEVSAQGVLLDWGRARSTPFRRLEAPFTIVQTDRVNEKRTAQRQEAKKRQSAKRKRPARRRGGADQPGKS
jgi:hypothetical protein